MIQPENEHLSDQLAEHVVYHDPELRIRWANRAACDSLGLAREDVVGRHCYELWEKSDAPCPDCPVTRAMSTGEPQQGERTTPDGRRWVIRGYPTFADNGAVSGGIEVTLDVTERHRAQEAYRTLVDQSLLGCIIIQDMHVVFANQAMAEITGYSVEEMLAVSSEQLHDFIHPDDRELVWGYHQARLEGQSLPQRYAFRAIRKDGDVRWLEISTSRIEYQGRPAIQGAYVDVTERVEVEQRLQEFRDTVNRSPAMVFLWRVAPGKWPVEFASANVERALGYTAEDFTSGRVSWPGITHPDDVPRLEAEVADHLCHGRREWSQEYRLITKSGQTRWFRDQNMALSDDDGQVTRIQSIVLDITEARRAEEALRYRLRFEEVVAHVSSLFVNLPADEIAMGFDRALEEVGPFTEADRSYLVMLHDNGTRMSQAYEWCAEGIDSNQDQMQGLETRRFPWIISQLTRAGLLNVPRVADIQPEAAECKASLEAGGVESLLSVPVTIGGEIFGFLGLSTVRREHAWSSDEISLVKIVAEVFANALERKRSADTLNEKLAFEMLLAELSTTFVNVPADEIDRQIEYWLGRVGEFLDIDRGTVAQLRGQGGDIKLTHSWAAPGLSRAPAVLPRDSFRWFIEQLGARRIVALSRIEDGPAEAVGEKQYALREGFKSVVVLPLTAGEAVLGGVVFSSLREERQWSDALLQRLRLVGEIFAHALARQQAHEALHASEQKFRALVEASSDWIWEVDADGVYTYASPKIKDLLGYTPDEVLGKTPFDLMDPAEAERTAALFDAHKRNARSFSGLLNANRHKNGGEVLLETSGVPILNTRGELLGYRGVDRDVTERQRMEDALRESEERFRGIFENAVLGLYRTTPDGRVLMANPSLLTMLGYDSFDGLAQTNVEEGYVRGYDRANFKRQIEADGRVHGYESAWLRRDGTPLFVRENARVIRDAQGRTLCYEGTVEDVTDRRRMEDALRASERNYREIFNATNEAIFVHDAETGDILDVNQTMLTMYGCDYEDVLRSEIADLSLGQAPYSQEEARQRIALAAREGPQLFEWLCRRSDGSVFWAEVNLKGAVIGGQQRILAVVRDIADRKQAQAEAQRHLTELTRAWHANTMGEMASGLAHELNQPLCAILNYSSGCLRMTRRPDVSVEMLRNPMEQIADQAERAANIIKHIRGLVTRREPHRSQLNINDVLVSALDIVRVEADQRDVTVVTRLGADLPLIQADPVEIEQVALNLMRNAIEAMSVPEVTDRTLEVATVRTDDDSIDIRVSDTGPGFPADLAETIFDSFFTTKHEGLGIGLSLSRRIVEAYGGRLWAESAGRAGATFRCTLPV